VGGTTLNLTSSGAYGSETAWLDSGGGYSQFELERFRTVARSAKHVAQVHARFLVTQGRTTSKNEGARHKLI